jgi:hypothetical protein
MADESSLWNDLFKPGPETSSTVKKPGRPKGRKTAVRPDAEDLKAKYAEGGEDVVSTPPFQGDALEGNFEAMPNFPKISKSREEQIGKIVIDLFRLLTKPEQEEDPLPF